ncbi:MAG: sensor histidine kinase [Nitrospinae bacterium]|nr:sensor histidine kinase [Nitrospinota bacterium]
MKFTWSVGRIVLTPEFIKTYSLMAFAVILISLFTLSAAVYSYETEITDRAQAGHDGMAHRLTKEMSLYFEEAAFQLQLVADNMDILSVTPETAKLALDATNADAFDFLDIYLYDTQKNVITSTAVEGLMETTLTDDDKLLFFPVVEDVTFSKVKFTKNKVPYVSIAVPFYDRGLVVGMLIGHLNLKRLWWWIDEVNTGRVMRLTIIQPKTGVIVADQAKKKVSTTYRHWPPRGKLSKANAWPGIIVHDGSGLKYLTYNRTFGFPLVLAITTDLTVYEANIASMRMNTAGICFLALLLCLLVTLRVTYKLMRNQLIMEDAMSMYEKHQLEADDPSLEKAGGLVKSFGSMIQNVDKERRQEIIQESLSNVGRMTSILAHDLRHGLHVILNVVYMMDQLDDSLKGIIVKTVHDLTTKTSDMMDFIRANKVDPRPTSVGSVALQAMETVKYSERAKDRDISITEDGNSKVTIVLDRQRMIAALANLMRNSVEAGAKKVTLSTKRIGDNIEFIVVDDGPGIPLELREKVWLPFFSTKSKGFGIGLALVETVARAHGGEAYIETTGEKGTDIRMLMPLVPPKYHGALYEVDELGGLSDEARLMVESVDTRGKNIR